MPQLDILSVWSNTTGHMALINCAISASYATFSAFVTLPWCINIDRTTPPVLSGKSKVTWKNEQYLGGHVPLRFKGRIMTNINNATAQRAVQMRERERENRKQSARCLQVRLCVDGRLCTQERHDTRKHERMEWITRWEQEKRRGNTRERWLCELMIKTACLLLFLNCEDQTWDDTNHQKGGLFLLFSNLFKG